MDRFFAIFGKIIFVITLLGSLTYVGYYFGKKSNRIEEIEIRKEEVSTSPTPIATNSQQLVTVVAGLSKSAGLSFDEYSIIVPEDWKSKKENQTQTDQKLILEKNGYEISIFQAATGGAVCLYNGDPDFEGPSSRFTFFKELITKDNKTLRRSGDLNGSAFTICQKWSDGSFGQPTSYGHMSIKLPGNYSEEMLTEIDSIIESLKKI